MSLRSISGAATWSAMTSWLVKFPSLTSRRFRIFGLCTVCLSQITTLWPLWGCWAALPQLCPRSQGMCQLFHLLRVIIRHHLPEEGTWCSQWAIERLLKSFVWGKVVIIEVYPLVIHQLSGHLILALHLFAGITPVICHFQLVSRLFRLMTKNSWNFTVVPQFF